jgi:uncharacterized phiE125 gp8 family phage protein
MLSYTRTVPPAAEPVSLQIAKSHLRVDYPEDDLLIKALITAATQYAEKYCNRSFFNQTWMLSLDNFPYVIPRTTVSRSHLRDYIDTGYWTDFTISLPKPTLVSVTSITYVDGLGQPQTLDPATYSVDIISEPARILPAPGLFWPMLQTYIPGSVKIKFVAGSYGDGVDVNTCPQTVVIAILLLVGHWYAHREESSELNLKNIPMGVQALLDTEKFTCLSYEIS